MSTRGRIRVEVLGPQRVVTPDGRDLTPDGPLQRRLLALLVLHRGRVVSTDSAIEVLWPAALPQDPVAALQNHLSRLRRGLPAELITSAGAGYRLDPLAIDLDCDRLAAVVSDEANLDEDGRDELDAVLARWQGPAFPELDELAAGRAESSRLEELRIRGREVSAQHRLDHGDTAGLVAEVTTLVDAEPLRERPRALLMAVLAATGRRVEALRVYDDFRRLLGAELGIEPSPAIAAQHAELLGGRPVAGWAPSSRLPVPPSSLVGRRALADRVTTLADDHRLVTLVGPGGVGKTRLLLEVGHRLRSARPDCPVVLCELAAADAASAIDVVAAALAIDARPGVPLVERIADVLGDAELVLLADNCEHVLAPIATCVEQLLTYCPNVTIVATSRERLRVPAETLLTVPTLPVEGPDSAAVTLFVDRARVVRPDLELTDGDLDCVAEVVRRLDGLPLAIELAAARLHTHEVREVAAGLDHRFALLSSGSRSVSRHGSLGAAVAWSFGLLDAHLQAVFTAVSTFAGSFTASDAAAVGDLEEVEAHAALAQLAERSLVTRAGEGRFTLLETLRAFGAEQLEAAGRIELVRGRHARHFVDWMELADGRILDPAHPFVRDVDAAIPELRSALAWLLGHDEVELAGRLVAALLDYGIMRLRADVLAWSEQVAAADPDDASSAASLVWVVAAYAAWMTGDVVQTGVRAARAVEVARRHDRPAPPEALTVCGSYALFEGRLDDAAEWYRRAAEAATDDPAQRLMATSSQLLALGYAGAASAAERAAGLVAEVGTPVMAYAAYVWYCAGEAVLAIDPPLARARFVTALDLAERCGISFVTGLAGASKASIDARTGDAVGTAGEYRRLIGHWRRAGMWSTQWTMLRAIAGLLARLGRHRDAAVLLGAVEATAAGHRIFGADELALRELESRLLEELGAAAFGAAMAEGAVLDGDAAVEHALAALRDET